MTNEEKKAYDNLIMLKYFTMEKEDKQAIETILNLIEKQSKEIEELKKNKLELINKHHVVHLKDVEKELREMRKAIDTKNAEIECLNVIHESYKEMVEENNYISKDKIKAKIEELKDEQEKEKNKDMSCDLTETRADNIDESTMLKQIKLKLQEKNIPIETLLAEFERLEDLEDDLTTVYLNGVYDGEKKVKDKIKAILKKYGKKEIEYAPDFYKEIQSLLEEE